MTFLMFCALKLPRLNLHVQIALVLLLTTGVLLAKAKRFRLHAVLQSTVVLLNLGLVLRVMLPSFRHQLPFTFPQSWRDVPVAIVLLHSFVGALAWLMAFYVVLVAGTPLIPHKLRFSNYRRWMWSAFLLWWTAFGLGCLLYFLSYVNP
jgi:uncharacterized membrane protein YozB (DUF420 family)